MWPSELVRQGDRDVGAVRRGRRRRRRGSRRTPSLARAPALGTRPIDRTRGSAARRSTSGCGRSRHPLRRRRPRHASPPRRDADPVRRSRRGARAGREVHDAGRVTAVRGLCRRDAHDHRRRPRRSISRRPPQLEVGQRSASYDATLAALRGCRRPARRRRPRLRALAGGHGHGALALEGGFDTRTLVSLGSPDRGRRRTRDAQHVAPPHRRSARDADRRRARSHGRRTGQLRRPARRRSRIAGLDDFAAPGARRRCLHRDGAHARRVDRSAHGGGARRCFDELGGAVSVEVTEYGAEREVTRAVSPSTAAAG